MDINAACHVDWIYYSIVAKTKKDEAVLFNLPARQEMLAGLGMSTILIVGT